jgi:hypothetical protein
MLMINPRDSLDCILRIYNKAFFHPLKIMFEKGLRYSTLNHQHHE